MRSRFAAVVAVLVSLSPFVALRAARADCAIPRGYQPIVDGNTVTICATNPDSQGTCPRPGGMLRVDTATGAAVQLADTCADGGVQGGCYVDECVPPGTYAYGYSTPFACCTFCCGTEQYSTATVAATPGAACDAGAVDVADAAAPGWDASALPGCTYSGGGSSSGSSSGSGDDSGAVTYRPDSGAAAPASSDGGGSSCATTPALGASHAVLAIDALALAVGLAFLARRRPRR